MGEARRNGKKESGKDAEEYFEQARDKYKEVEGDYLWFKIASIERSMRVAKHECGEEEESTETGLKRSRDLYDKAISSHGKETLDAILAGEQLARELQAYRGIESQRLITELYTICKRIYGLNHPTTKQVNHC